MKRRSLPLIAGLVLVSIAPVGAQASAADADPPAYPKVCVHWGRAWGADLQYTPEEIEALDAVAMVANAYRPEEVEPLRGRRKDRVFLYNVTVGQIPWPTRESAFRMERWQLEDCGWSPIRRHQKAFLDARDAGIDWVDRDPTGAPKQFWGGLALRWDDACPRWNGRTAAETWTEIVLDLSCDPAWPWDGWWFDTYPDRSHQRATSMRMLEAVIDGTRPDEPIVVGQSWIDDAVRRKINGRKVEQWWWQYSTTRMDWFAWWYGDHRTMGYLEIENAIRRPGAPDCWTGWDMTVLDGMIPPDWGWSEDRIRQHWRYLLATALLGEGYASFERSYEQRWDLAPEVHEWRFVKAMTGVFWVPDSRVPTRQVACRVFRWPGAEERYATVVVNPHTHEGYLVHGWYGPGRSLDPTPDRRRKY